MSRLGELTHKVDAFFARVEARHGTDMQCQTGCSDCCHVRLTITQVEAAAIRSEVAAWPPAQRAVLAHTGPDDRCAALDGVGRCKIYNARPLVCRSHGVPIRLRRGALPVVEACHHNFRRTTPEADCVLDQTTLSATLFAIDAAARPPDADPGSPRVELAGLLAELAAIC
ncbi:MAG: YkgJ family cysteine cluster protein [Kofleriaceae bacterium]